MEFWFDFASTYSYLAAFTVSAEDNIRVDWRPFALGPIFAAQGWNDSPFNLFAAKGTYMWRDMERLCEREGLPFRRPTVFPRRSVHAARVALLARDEGFVPEFSRAVFRANFAEDRAIEELTVLSEILVDLGRSADLIEEAEGPKRRPQLREATQTAMRLGIFGAPTFVVNGELFWGQDRLQDAVAWAHKTT